MHNLSANRQIKIGLSIANSWNHRLHAGKILSALARQDFNELRRLAQAPGGFLLDSIRQRVWPVLLHTQYGCYLNEKGSEEDLADPHQIAKDIERSFYYYPQGISSAQKARKQKELHDLIIEILWRNPRLKYYQGFHDICSCFLLVLGKKDAIPAAENTALFYLRDAMLDSFDPVSKQLHLMSSIIEFEDAELSLFLNRCHVMPYYALSWILTWYSHDFVRFDKVARLFDLFIASPPLMPVYCASAVILLRRSEILASEPDLLHSVIRHIPQDIDIERVIQLALQLANRYPALNLQKRTGIWLHDGSPVNTWDLEWKNLSWNDVPDTIQADRYLSVPILKEQWDDE
ncbi:tbc1 domain family member 20-like [Lichtheimia corymbifera JMRC:FSU:9682]|uniref:Tbc1 domain family member 20-like n=1 Tax=Lichtheimia corymbifera JMRC:FSU:9682 TaxID=1263082 RepID=A0A068RVJ2_9FUNG|nr:tbc1 domain family member 20-like [Lichtheimia corymbifera JMRC:FSU:9682]